MSRIRLAILAVAVALLAGCRSSSQPADGGSAESLEGSWEVTSVQRDGETDPLQVGGAVGLHGQRGNVPAEGRADRGRNVLNPPAHRAS